MRQHIGHNHGGSYDRFASGGFGINAVNEATSMGASFNSSVIVTNAATIQSGAG